MKDALTEDEKTKAALWAALLLASKEIVAHRNRQATIASMKPPGSQTFEPIPLKDFMAINPDRLDAEECIADVVGFSLKLTIRRLGKQLYAAHGDTEALYKGVGQMLKAFDNEGDGELADIIIDKAWDGIGAGEDRWWS